MVPSSYCMRLVNTLTIDHGALSVEHVPHARFSFFQLLACIHIMFDQVCIEYEVSVDVECVILACE